MHRSRMPAHPGEVLREDVIKPLALTVTEVTKTSLPDSWLYMPAHLDIWYAAQKPTEVVESGTVALA